MGRAIDLAIQFVGISWNKLLLLYQEEQCKENGENSITTVKNVIAHVIVTKGQIGIIRVNVNEVTFRENSQEIVTREANVSFTMESTIMVTSARKNIEISSLCINLPYKFITRVIKSQKMIINEIMNRLYTYVL